LLVFIPYDEIAFVVEDQHIREGIKEDVEILELLIPRLSKVDERERSRVFDKDIHRCWRVNSE